MSLVSRQGQEGFLQRDSLIQNCQHLTPRAERSPCLSRAFLLLCYRFPCPGSPRCHFLRARSLPGHASPSLSAVQAGQGPGPWLTSRPEPSRPRLRGQRPPPPPGPGGQCQDPARAGGDPRAGEEEESPAEPPRLQQPEKKRWNRQELEAGEIREDFFPKWRGRRSRELRALLLEHNYSQRQPRP